MTERVWLWVHTQRTRSSLTAPEGTEPGSSRGLTDDEDDAFAAALDA